MVIVMSTGTAFGVLSNPSGSDTILESLLRKREKYLRAKPKHPEERHRTILEHITSNGRTPTWPSCYFDLCTIESFVWGVSKRATIDLLRDVEDQLMEG